MTIKDSIGSALAISGIALTMLLSLPRTTQGQQVSTDSSVSIDSRGCKNRLIKAESGWEITSTVPCVGGWLQGNGVLQGKRGGITLFLVDFAAGTGLVFREGRVVVAINPADLSFEPTSCGMNGPAVMGAGVIRVPDTLAIYDSSLADSVLIAGAKKILAACQRAELGRLFVVRDSVLRTTPARDIQVSLTKPQQFALYCDGFRVNEFKGSVVPAKVECRWSRLSPAADEHRRRIEAVAATERQEIERLARAEREAAAARAAREQAERAAAEAKQREQVTARAAQERADRLAKLRSQYGQFSMVSLEELHQNPFAWQGKLIATCTSFERMSGPTTAKFGAVYGAIVTGVPTTRYLRSTSNQFLIARVTGQTAGDPSIQFVAAMDGGGSYGCQNYLSR